MHGYIERQLSSIVENRLNSNPVVALLGPRQCGKSTLVQKIIENVPKSVYLDLESPADLNKLNDLEAFFEVNKNRLVCLDEIQRKPEIFPVLRGIVDKNRRNGQIMILGSASRDLIKQSSETLAGRISYLELTPFILSEIAENSNLDILRNIWLKGGFPRSYLASSIDDSFQWRTDFIRTFLERDIPQLGFNIPSAAMRRLWQMCAHLHGQLLNSSKLGESLGVSNHTVRNYIDLLEQTFMLRVMHPVETNLKKRLVKSPRIYLRDSGILHALLDVISMNDLLGHPVYGSSWEGFVLENIIAELPGFKAGFYRASSGAEIDCVLEKGRRRIAVECKASSAPQVTRGFWTALNDLNIKEAWIIAPVKESYPDKDNVMVASVSDFIAAMKSGDSVL